MEIEGAVEVPWLSWLNNVGLQACDSVVLLLLPHSYVVRRFVSVVLEHDFMLSSARCIMLKRGQPMTRCHDCRAALVSCSTCSYQYKSPCQLAQLQQLLARVSWLYQCDPGDDKSAAYYREPELYLCRHIESSKHNKIDTDSILSHCLLVCEGVDCCTWLGCVYSMPGTRVHTRVLGIKLVFVYSSSTSTSKY